MEELKRLKRAFLFEAAIGALTLVAVLLLDQAGISVTALLFFRPWIVGRGRGDADQEVREIYKDASWIGMGVTALGLLLVYLAYEFDVTTSLHQLLLLLLLVLPLFLLSHGLAGYVLTTSRSSD